MDSTINSYYSDGSSKEGPSIKRNSKLRVLHLSMFLTIKIFKKSTESSKPGSYNTISYSASLSTTSPPKR